MFEYWKDLSKRFKESFLEAWYGAFGSAIVILGISGMIVFLIAWPLFVFQVWQLILATYGFYGVICIFVVLMNDYKKFRRNIANCGKNAET